jgi:hypothetical protein
MTTAAEGSRREVELVGTRLGSAINSFTLCTSSWLTTRMALRKLPS